MTIASSQTQTFTSPQVSVSLPIKLIELVFNFYYLGSINEEPRFLPPFPCYFAKLDPLWKDILLKFWTIGLEWSLKAPMA
jgi:hypothetical protein